MTCELVQEYGNPINAANALEVCLNLLRTGAIVYVADEDTPRVDVFFALAHLVAFVVKGLLHLTELCCLVLHFLHAAPHGGDLFLLCALVRTQYEGPDGLVTTIVVEYVPC